jgi:ribosomal-protein-alanine N-acetyltransferase
LPLNTIQTSRLIIRRFIMDDLQDIHRILDVVLKMDDLTLDQRADWLRWTVMNDVQLERLYQPPYGEKAVVLKENNQLIGAVGLVQSVTPAGQLAHYTPNPMPNALIRPEMGLYYACDPAYQGKGYVTEAAQALIDYAFTDLRLERIIATTDYDNEKSQAVMRRLGMDIQRNPFPDPFWCQIVGILENPAK